MTQFCAKAEEPTDGSAGRSPRNHQARILPLVSPLLVGLIAFLYFWTADLSGARRTYVEPEGYYNLQTLGFMRGHLYVALEPNPALLALPDPYDPVANAPYRVHDMTLWQGKYYLYFGVAPVLVVFLPFRLITGRFLAEPMAVAMFCSIGLGMAASLLMHLRRHWFPKYSGWHALILVAALGLGCPTLLLNQLPQFYQVPISCAYAFSMAGLFCIGRMLTADPCRRGRWLLAAGFLLGLTQAARPNYVLSMPLLLLPVWWCACNSGGPKRMLKPLLVGFGPVAAIGIGLLAYNWLRFGNPFEFGMRYQLAGQNFVNFTPLAWQNLGPHAAEYLWQQVWWQPSFPFLVVKPEAPFGVLRYLPLVWIGLLACWPITMQGERQNSGKLILVGVIAGLGAANLIMDSIFFFAPVLRYVCDFAPALILLGTIGAMTAAQIRRLGGWISMLGIVCAVVSVAVVLAIYVQRLPEPQRPAGMARLLNKFAATGEQWLGQRYGRLRLTVELPPEPVASVEPLFQTGYSDDQRDWLQVHYVSKTQVQFGFFHAGLGEILGQAVALPADRRLVVEAACSALLPSSDHPLFATWSAGEIEAARRKLEIIVNGRVVLSAALQCYPSRPWDLQVGVVGFGSDAVRPRFSGRVLAEERMPVVREAQLQREISVHRPLRLRLILPADGTGYEPLVATGEKGQGELLYLIYGPGHTVQLALDSQRRGAVFGRAVKFDPVVATTLDLWMGVWDTTEPRRELIGSIESPGLRFYAKLGDEVIFNSEYSFQSGADLPVALGWNRIGSGAASAEFSGRILEVQEMDWSILPAKPFRGQFGAVDLDLEFPMNAYGQAEPLVTTGKSGAGDILFVKYLDAGLVQFRKHAPDPGRVLR